MLEDFDELMRVQRATASRLRTENEMDRKVKLMGIIQTLNPDRKGRILTESIMVEARNEGFSDDETDHLIDGLEEDGYVRKVDQGIMVLL